VTGLELRKLRVAKFVRPEALVCRIGYDKPKLERLEAGTRAVSEATVKRYLKALDGALRFRESTKRKPVLSPDSLQALSSPREDTSDCQKIQHDSSKGDRRAA
jgi:hypothetical protein